MPYQRTITIYEYIPVDELGKHLDDEERVIAEVINQHLAEIRGREDYEEIGLSWDEVLVWCTDVEDYYELCDRAIVAIEESVKVEKPRLGLLSDFYPMSKKDRLRHKFGDFLSRQDLNAASLGAVVFWLLSGINSKNIEHYEKTLKLTSDNLQIEQQNMENTQSLMMAVVQGITVSSKGKLRDTFMCQVIKNVLERKGVHWQDFNPKPGAGGGVLTHSELFELCKAENTLLFPSPKNGGDWMRRIMWPVFNQYRQRVALKISNRLYFQTD